MAKGLDVAVEKKKPAKTEVKMATVKAAKTNTIVSKKSSGTVIKKCSCLHKWQDETYGVGMRVMNVCAATKAKAGKCVCVICKTVHNLK